MNKEIGARPRRARRFAPVVLATILLPTTMPAASTSFTQRLGVGAGVSIAEDPPAQEKTPSPSFAQAGGNPPMNSLKDPTEPVAGPQPDELPGAAPADEQSSGAHAEKAPAAVEHRDQGDEFHEECAATTCPQHGGPPSNAETPGMGATAPSPAATDPSPNDPAAAGETAGFVPPAPTE